MIRNFFLYRRESINDVYALKRFFLLCVKPNYRAFISFLAIDYEAQAVWHLRTRLLSIDSNLSLSINSSLQYKLPNIVVYILILS